MSLYVGATGIVGKEVLKILFETGFPLKQIYAVASKNSLGKKVEFGSSKIAVVTTECIDCKLIDLVFCAVENDIAEILLPKFENATVIDKSSLHRMDKDVPLVVSKVNESSLLNKKK